MRGFPGATHSGGCNSPDPCGTSRALQTSQNCPGHSQRKVAHGQNVSRSSMSTVSQSYPTTSQDVADTDVCPPLRARKYTYPFFLRDPGHDSAICGCGRFFSAQVEEV
ncbi:unnamed protein product [Prorocentrum cordatum]|uniref:Uncharacterized protein n=1 Tax=Prorocentrum cordatum TaxID=2364126 RepID=A0ABN9RWU0_9DINO|nr:unnamed protein product [Polarella glacialis]